jgi:hypothetical protein
MATKKSKNFCFLQNGIFLKKPKTYQRTFFLGLRVFIEKKVFWDFLFRRTFEKKMSSGLKSALNSEFFNAHIGLFQKKNIFSL